MKKIITTFLIFSSVLLTAQNKDTKEPITNTTVQNSQFKANLIAPGLDYEKGIAPHATLGLNLGTEILYATNTITDDRGFAGIYLSFKGYYRHYYNFKRRIDKGKYTNYNSANFFGLSTTYINTNPIIKGKFEVIDNAIIIPAAIYGIQRSFQKKFNFVMEFGLGYSISNIEKQVVPVINANFGWILF